MRKGSGSRVVLCLPTWLKERVMLVVGISWLWSESRQQHLDRLALNYTPRHTAAGQNPHLDQYSVCCTGHGRSTASQCSPSGSRSILARDRAADVLGSGLTVGYPSYTRLGDGTLRRVFLRKSSQASPSERRRQRLVPSLTSRSLPPAIISLNTMNRIWRSCGRLHRGR